MEKSIETIWKEGFIKNNALVAPKLNDLYNQKSIDIVERFKRMYKINRIALVLFAIVLAPVSYLTRMPSMGIMISILFIAVVIVAQKFSKQLDTIDKNKSSYEYLSSFDKWVKNMIAVNSKLSTFIYPYIFIAVASGFWFLDLNDYTLGEKITNFLTNTFPNTYLINGFPLLLITPLSIIIGLLTFFGGKIGKWDINLVYGGILRRLDDLLSDMKELRE